MSEPRPQSLDAGDVGLLYRELLGREPSSDDVAHQLASASSWRDLLVAIVASEEYRAVTADPLRRAASGARVVNTFTRELAAYGYPIGTTSPNGIAQVGREGWVFLVGGTNQILSQYRGDFAFDPDWSERWEAALAVRRAEAGQLGAKLVVLLVPDKLPVMSQFFPEPLDDGAGSAAGRLTALASDVVFPLVPLQRVPEGAFLRTDTHLSLAGNIELARVLGAALGVDLVGDVVVDGVVHLTAGDLGAKFDPQIVELVTTRGDWGRAELVEDDSARLLAAGPARRYPAGPAEQPGG